MAERSRDSSIFRGQPVCGAGRREVDQGAYPQLQGGGHCRLAGCRRCQGTGASSLTERMLKVVKVSQNYPCRALVVLFSNGSWG
jgi:hypothetical protein